MADDRTILEETYAAFNARDIDAALARMTEDVHWPKASEGGSIVGKEAIRAYWTRQWSEFNPHVEPLSIHAEDHATVRVLVHQLVKSLNGDLLSDSKVTHMFTMRDGRIAAMTLGNAETASAAFPHKD